MRHAIKGLAIGMGSGLLVWAVLLGACYADERPPTLAPIRVGMTVSELGAARPGTYAVHPVFRDCPRAKDLGRAQLRTFTGAVAFRLPDGFGDTLEFAGGSRRGFGFESRPPTRVSRLIPGGMALGTALKRLPKGSDARIMDGGTPSRELPREAASLRHYAGRITGETGWGTYGMNRIWWNVELRDGRVTKIEEHRYED